MTVTGPWFTDSPRYAGEHWRVTVKTDNAVRTHGFKTEDEAREFARGLRSISTDSEAPR